MTNQLVFVHGRSQEGKDAVALKAQWIEALRRGLAKSDLELPVSEEAVRFPYYGQTLDDLVKGVPQDRVAEVVVRGDNDSPDQNEQAFVREVVEEVRATAGVTDDQIATVVGAEVIERGPQNWLWVRGALAAMDRYVPGASGASIALATKDVYQYLRNIGIRDRIEAGVRGAMEPEVPCVVVGHSLGSVVSYCLLRREGKASRWTVPLLVTVGSPLAVAAIKRSLAPNKHPDCVGHWYNAMDHRDLVALHPLNSRYFPIDPEIENKTSVDNSTGNRHGITGYLDDQDVARRIHDALIA